MVLIIRNLLATINYTFTFQFLPRKRCQIVSPGLELYSVLACPTVVSHWLLTGFMVLPHPPSPPP